jgi:hypothetical protein
MFDLVPCPHQGCDGGKVHSLVGFDIFCDDCPTCEGMGTVKGCVFDLVTDIR